MMHGGELSRTITNPISADSEFLQGILDSLKRRSKAFKHRNLRFQIERILEVGAEHSIERIDLEALFKRRSGYPHDLGGSLHLRICWGAE